MNACQFCARTDPPVTENVYRLDSGAVIIEREHAACRTSYEADRAATIARLVAEAAA